MNGSTEVIWAAILIVGVPLVVVLFGEVAERLRQRDSPYASAVALVRTWVLPLGVAYLGVRALLALDADRPVSRVLASALIVAASLTAMVVLRVVIARSTRRADEERRARPPQLLLAIPRVLLVGVALWLLLSVVWGVALSGALAALGLTSLIVSLALSSTLSGLASGFLLLADQPFRPGEWIQVDDLEGQVVDINWRTTRICNRNGDLVVIPNSSLATATIVNYDQPSRVHRVTLRVQVAFSNAPNRAIEMLMAAARSTPGVLTEPAPDVKVIAVDDPLMEYEVQVWVDDHGTTPRVRSDLAGLIWYWSERLDVPLPSPAQDLYLWDGPTTAAAELAPAHELRAHLADSPMLQALPERELDLLAAAAHRVRYAAGETLDHGLDSGLDRGHHRLCVLHTGRARLVIDLADGTRATVAELARGDLFGLLHHERNAGGTTTVVAMTDCDVVEVDGATADIVVGRNPALADAMTHLASARRRRVDVLLTESGPTWSGPT